MRESTIEKAVCNYAKTRGVLVFKCTGKRGIPDRIFHYKGHTWYFEFKAPGEKPTPLQIRTIRKLCEQDIVVQIIDDVEDGKHAIERELTWVSEQGR